MIAALVVLSASVALVTALLVPGYVIGFPRLAEVTPGHQHSEPTPVPEPQPATTPAPATGNSLEALLGDPPLPADQTSGPMDVYARRLQDIDNLFVTVRLHLSGRYEVTSSVSVPGSKPATYNFKPVVRTVPAHLKTKAVLRLSKRSRSVVKRALRRGERLVVKVDVDASRPGASKSAARAKRNVRLRFEGNGPVEKKLADILNVLRALVSGDVTAKGISTKAERGPQGPAGEPGQPGRSALSELQGGETIRGTVGGQTAVPVDTEVAYSATLPVPAPFGLDDDHVNVDGVDETAANECQGSASDPQAAPGYVCIYPFSHYNDRDGRGFVWGNTQEGTSKWGFQVAWYATGGPPDNTGFFANWAYTAPGTAPPPSEHNH
jgi:hypothetical protein